VYLVEFDGPAEEQLLGVPHGALTALAAAVVSLGSDPWAGDSFGPDPKGNMRTELFGPNAEGMLVYVILERQQRVVVVRVVWLDLS
jgi:hypothetical protein